MRRVRTIRNKRERIKNNVVDDSNEVRSFIIIVMVLVIAISAIYIVTELVGRKKQNNNSTTVGTINYDTISVGMLLNRPYDEYYVIIYDSESNDSILYGTLSTEYTMNENDKKLYYIDLSNELNKKYYNANKSNPKASTIDELALGDLTLIQVKKGKIVKYLEDYNAIKKILTEN